MVPQDWHFVPIRAGSSPVVNQPLLQASHSRSAPALQSRSCNPHLVGEPDPGGSWARCAAYWNRLQYYTISAADGQKFSLSGTLPERRRPRRADESAGGAVCVKVAVYL